MYFYIAVTYRKMRRFWEYQWIAECHQQVDPQWNKKPGNYQKNGRKRNFGSCAGKVLCYNRGFLASLRQRKSESHRY